MDTVDRYVKALVKVGALSVERRIDDNGDWTSNRYVLHACPSAARVRLGGRTGAATGGRTDAATGGRTDAAQTKPNVEPDPLEADKNNTAPIFDAFWPAYLNAFGSKRSGSRGAASKAWEKLAKTQRVEAMEAVARHGQCLRSDPHGYAVPHASTWLNDCRFMDATLLERPSSTSNGRANPFAERLRHSAAPPPQGQLS